MATMDKSQTGTAPSISGQINLPKVAANNAANLNPFKGVRTTVTSAAEGRLKVGAGSKSKKAKKAILKKAVKKAVKK